MTFLKDNLAKEILLYDRVQLSDMQEFARSSNYPNFEVRTVGSAGTVQIKFPHQEWIKPVEWAMNHRTTILNNLYCDLLRAENLDTIKSSLEDLGYIHQTVIEQRIRDYFSTLNQDEDIAEMYVSNVMRVIVGNSNSVQ